MPNGEGLFSRNIMPWREVRAIYGSQYRIDVFWAWLEQASPDGFRVPPLARLDAGTRKDSLEQTLEKSLVQFNKAILEGEVGVPKPFWYLGSEEEWEADPRSKGMVEVAPGVWERQVPLAPPTTFDEWMARLSPGERELYESQIRLFTARYKNVTPDRPEMPEEIKTALNEYIFSVWQQTSTLLTEPELNKVLEAAGYVTQEQKDAMSDTEFSRIINEWMGDRIAWGQIDITSPPELRDFVEDEAYQEKLEVGRRFIPEHYKTFLAQSFPDLPAELTSLMYSHAQRMVRTNIKSALITGQMLTDIQALSALTDREIADIGNQATFDWVRGTTEYAYLYDPTAGIEAAGGMVGAEAVTREGLPLVGAVAQLSKVAQYAGMEPFEYIQSTFQDWRTHLPTEYVADKSNEDLMSEFLTAWGGYTGERSSLLGYIEADTMAASEAVGAEKETVRERITPKYERIPTPAQYEPPGMEVTTPETTWRVAPTQPAAKLPAEKGFPFTPITATQAKSQYLTELKRRGYGAEDIRYLTQFFPTYWAGGGIKQGKYEWSKYLRGIDIPSPPRRTEAKTRFLRRA